MAPVRRRVDDPAAFATYRDPGPDYYDCRHAHRVTRHAIELLERQGYRVSEPAA